MAAKPQQVLPVDCPPPSWNNAGGAGGGRQRREWTCGPKARVVAVLVLLGAAFITGVTLLGVFLHRKFPTGSPVYTVAITGVAGLDALSPPPPPSPPPPAAVDDDDYIITPPPPPATEPMTLSPVFDLAFQIDNSRNGQYKECLPGLSRADVSYGDAFLAGGSVPPLCAGKTRRRAAAARAWGEGVAVPRFLGDQLAAELAAGGAAVDVKVTMPSYCTLFSCGGAVLSCKPRIGGGPSPACRLDFL